jgi:hypothetical protein
MTFCGLRISPDSVDIDSRPEYIQTPMARPRANTPPVPKNGWPGAVTGASGSKFHWPALVRWSCAPPALAGARER